MRPVLFSNDATSYTTQGLGTLSDAVSCKVTEKLNDSFELEMTYPLSGIHASDITVRSVIAVDSDSDSGRQAFRVYQVTKPIGGLITVYARHISYDLSYYPVGAYTADSLTSALQGISDSAIAGMPFTFQSDFEDDTKSYTNPYPQSARALLFGSTTSFRYIYGGDWVFDNYTCTLTSERGENRGTRCFYGKNLATFELEENDENQYTGVMCVWHDDDGNYVCGDVISTATFDYTKIYTYDVSDQYTDTVPEVEDLNSAARTYITNNSPASSDLTADFTFDQISGKVLLGDTVTVVALDAIVTARVTTVVWDCLQEHIDSCSIGSVKVSFIDKILALQESLKKVITTSTSANIKAAEAKESIPEAVANATALITGQTGGYICINTDDSGAPYELLIMDTPDIDTATNVWRWNLSGLGFSGNGYNGEYFTAITQDGAIVADAISTGTIRSLDGLSYWDLDTGELVIKGYATEEEMDTRVTEVSDALADYTESVEQYMRFDSSTGLMLGAQDSDFATIISNTQLSFVEGGTVVAYINGEKLYISSAAVTDGLDIGKYRFAPHDTDDGFSITYTG